MDSSFPDVRQLAANCLAEHKDEACLPVLTAMLTSTDRTVARHALIGLEAVSSPAVPGILLDRIEADADSASKLLDSLQNCGRPADVPRLLKLLDTPKLRSSVFDAIVEICDDEDEPHEAEFLALLKRLTEVGDIKLLESLVPQLADFASKELDALLAPLAEFKDDDVRHAAILAASEREGCIELLRGALKHEDAISKFLGAEGLAKQGHDDGIQILLTGIDLLANVDHRVRAVKALGTLASERALDQLLRLATEEDHALQEAAIEAIGHMGRSAHAERIFEILTQACDKSGLKGRALYGLRWFDSPAGWQIIRDAHEDGHWYVRQCVAELLEHDSDDSSIEILAELIREDWDEDVIEAAAKSLRARFGEESLEPDYIFLQSDDTYTLDEVAPDHLKRACEQGDPARLLEIFAKIADEKQPEVRNALLARNPLPFKAAAEALDHAISLDILGRAWHSPGKGKLAALTEEEWRKGDERDEHRLASLIWVSGRVGETPAIWKTILESGECLHLRSAILVALDTVPKDFRPILEQIRLSGESELAEFANQLLGDDDLRSSRSVEAKASDLAMVDALARQGAEKELVKVAKNEDYDEDLRKHAWRSLRRLKRSA